MSDGLNADFAHHRMMLKAQKHYQNSLLTLWTEMHQRKMPLQITEKAFEVFSGSRGSRTPDPLLVRQML